MNHDHYKGFLNDKTYRFKSIDLAPLSRKLTIPEPIVKARSFSSVPEITVIIVIGA